MKNYSHLVFCAVGVKYCRNTNTDAQDGQKLPMVTFNTGCLNLCNAQMLSCSFTHLYKFEVFLIDLISFEDQSYVLFLVNPHSLGTQQDLMFNLNGSKNEQKQVTYCIQEFCVSRLYLWFYQWFFDPIKKCLNSHVDTHKLSGPKLTEHLGEIVTYL